MGLPTAITVQWVWVGAAMSFVPIRLDGPTTMYIQACLGLDVFLAPFTLAGPTKINIKWDLLCSCVLLVPFKSAGPTVINCNGRPTKLTFKQDHLCYSGLHMSGNRAIHFYSNMWTHEDQYAHRVQQKSSTIHRLCTKYMNIKFI